MIRIRYVLQSNPLVLTMPEPARVCCFSPVLPNGLNLVGADKI
jgi:hypothetical protein